MASCWQVLSNEKLEVPMKLTFKAALGAPVVFFAAQAAAKVTFYEVEGFRGRPFTVNRTLWNFEPTGFNDKARSAVVDRGRWEVCEDAGFQGRCVVLRPGSYDSLAGMGMNAKISSVRPISQNARYNEYDTPEPLAAPTYDYR